MPRKEKAIFVHSDIFNLLKEAKLHTEGLTGARLTWGSFLYMLASGALAMSTFAGLELKCPVCGHTAELYYREPKKKAKS